MLKRNFFSGSSYYIYLTSKSELKIAHSTSLVSIICSIYYTVVDFSLGLLTMNVTSNKPFSKILNVKMKILFCMFCMFWRHGGLMRNQDFKRCSTQLESCLSTMCFVYWTWLNLSTVYTSGAGNWPKWFKNNEKKSELPNICPSSKAVTTCICPNTTSKVRNLTLRGSL